MNHEAGEGEEEEEAEGKRRNFSGEFVFFSRSKKNVLTTGIFHFI